jgi:hypothetical protein
METPSTSQKRKRDAFEDPRSEGTVDMEGDDAQSRNGYSGSEYEGTPTKRLKSSGTFEQMLKRKENGSTDRGSERLPARAHYKRHRV